MIRFLDILFSLIGLIILSPFFILISVLILLDFDGPAFYRQPRVGKNGVDFLIYKFRTMRSGSDARGLLTVGGRDPRVTPTGYFLRKYKIDELPQLFNVLKGEMSIAGPRPEVRKYVRLYNQEQLKILEIRPGITDFASIKYKSENEILAKYPDPEKAYVEIIMPEKISLNMVFVNDHSLKNYFRIIFSTLTGII
jgi:lipopolysaccharide/colanic/teichoic acid biosynthesis glycosyltransferase